MFFQIILLTFCYTTDAQYITDKKKFADSLFTAKKLTQAFTIYQDIYENEKKYAPNILLKMSYIQETLGNYSLALFYLNSYYLIKNDSKYLEKLDQLGEKYALKGYEYSDFDFFQLVLRKFNIQIILFLCFTSIILLFILKKIKDSRRQKRYALVLILNLTLLFLVLNVFNDYNRGIIGKEKVFLMAAPSAAAKPIALVNNGHKVKIIGDADIWYKIIWDNEVAYIRKENLILFKI